MRARLASALVLLGILALVPATSLHSAGGAPLLRLKGAEFDPLQGPPALPDRLRLIGEPAGGYFLVQLRDAVTPAALERLKASGARALLYVPDQGYLVTLAPGRAASVRALPDVRWLGPFQPAWKIAPDLGRRPFEDRSRRTGDRLTVTVDLFPREDLAAAAGQAAHLGAELLTSWSFSEVRRLLLRGSVEQIEQLAHWPAVAWIEEAGEATLRNTNARWVMQSNAQNVVSIWDHGLHGEGQVIGIIDTPLDMNSCFFRDPVNNTPGPGHRKVVAYRSNAGQGAASHGTHTSGSAAGDQFPLNGTLASNGQAYAAKLSFSSLNDITGSGSQTSNLYQRLGQAQADGARVHTNSWGDDGTTAYTTWTQDADRFSHDFEDALVLFAVTNTSSLKTPENGKNVLAVGASLNGTSASSFCSGGSGPTNDGRRKPEIYAPGCSIVSSRTGSTCLTQSMTGTSMASPAVAGAAALARQYFVEGWYPTGTPQPADALAPSGALLRALLLNSAVDMTGIAGYPGNQEGWGRVLLENALYFAGDARGLVVLADVRNASGLTTGASVSYPLQVADSVEPLEVTLVFTEPAAALFANPSTINNLDLELTSPSGTLYRGNVFAGGVSTPGGSADAINTAELALLPSPEPGEWTITVRGTAVNQGSQGYALVVTGQVEAASGGELLRYSAHQVSDPAPFGNADGRLDPGETVTVPLTLRNLLPQAVTSVAATLASGMPELVAITTRDAAYPDIPGGGTAGSIAPHYRLTVAPDAACGTAIPFDVGAAIAGGSLAHSSFAIEVGRSVLDFGAGDVPQPVPVSGTVISTASVTEPVTIGDVNVSVSLLHGAVNELTLILTSPAGTEVTLHDGSGSGANILAAYDTDRPVDGPGSMSDFDGQQAQGTWTLMVKDAVSGPTAAGTLLDWHLAIAPPGGPVCTPLTCGGDPVPAAVAPTARAGREAVDDLRLTWQAVPGADAYRVWRSLVPSFAHPELVATTPTPAVVLDGAASGPELHFYRIHAINACDWQGP